MLGKCPSKGVPLPPETAIAGAGTLLHACTRARSHTHAHTHTQMRGAVPFPSPNGQHLQFIFSPAHHSEATPTAPPALRTTGARRAVASVCGRAGPRARPAVCPAGSGKSSASQGLQARLFSLAVFSSFSFLRKRLFLQFPPSHIPLNTALLSAAGLTVGRKDGFSLLRGRICVLDHLQGSHRPHSRVQSD